MTGVAAAAIGGVVLAVVLAGAPGSTGSGDDERTKTAAEVTSITFPVYSTGSMSVDDWAQVQVVASEQQSSVFAPGTFRRSNLAVVTMSGDTDKVRCSEALQAGRTTTPEAIPGLDVSCVWLGDGVVLRVTDAEDDPDTQFDVLWSVDDLLVTIAVPRSDPSLGSVDEASEWSEALVASLVPNDASAVDQAELAAALPGTA